MFTSLSDFSKYTNLTGKFIKPLSFVEVTGQKKIIYTRRTIGSFWKPYGFWTSIDEFNDELLVDPSVTPRAHIRSFSVQEGKALDFLTNWQLEFISENSEEDDVLEFEQQCANGCPGRLLTLVIDTGKGADEIYEYEFFLPDCWK